RVDANVLLPLGIGALLAAIALRAGGGLQLQPTTEVEMALEIGGGVVAAGSLLAGRDRRAAYGMPALLCFAALVALTIASVLWSVNPSASWLEASRTLSYAVVFGVTMVFARFAPQRWAAVVGATVVASIVICVYALLTKIFPGALNPDEIYARLREPFGYWNAIGLMAALGAPGSLWLGARRGRSAARPAQRHPPCGRRGDPRRAGARADRRRGRAGVLHARARRFDLARLEAAHRPARLDAAERPRTPDRRRLGARALLERGAEDVEGPPRQGRRRRRLRDAAPALSPGRPRRAPRPRLRRADACRPRRRRDVAQRRAAGVLAGRRNLRGGAPKGDVVHA